MSSIADGWMDDIINNTLALHVMYELMLTPSTMLKVNATSIVVIILEALVRLSLPSSNESFLSDL